MQEFSLGLVQPTRGLAVGMSPHTCAGVGSLRQFGAVSRDSNWRAPLRAVPRAQAALVFLAQDRPVVPVWPRRRFLGATLRLRGGGTSKLLGERGGLATGSHSKLREDGRRGMIDGRLRDEQALGAAVDTENVMD